jgi:hypothetical protein
MKLRPTAILFTLLTREIFFFPFTKWLFWIILVFLLVSKEILVFHLSWQQFDSDVNIYLYHFLYSMDYRSFNFNLLIVLLPQNLLLPHFLYVDNTFVELMSIYHSLKFARNLGYKYILCYSDSFLDLVSKGF